MFLDFEDEKIFPFFGGTERLRNEFKLSIYLVILSPIVVFSPPVWLGILWRATKALTNKQWIINLLMAWFVPVLILGGLGVYEQEPMLIHITFSFIRLITGVVGLLSLSALVYGGYLYLYGGGSDEKDKGKKSVKKGILGFALIFAVWGLINII